jgi:hypothetical protein
MPPVLTMVPSAVPSASTICVPPLTVTSLLLSPADIHIELATVEDSRALREAPGKEPGQSA